MDVPSVLVHDFLTQSESDACAWEVESGVQSFKDLEYLAGVVLIEPNAIIHHLEDVMVFRLGTGDADFTWVVGVTELEGVAQQVLKQHDKLLTVP